MFYHKKIAIFLVLFITVFSATLETFSANSPRRRTTRHRGGFVLGDNIMPKHIKGLRMPKPFLRGLYLDCTRGSNLNWVKRLIKEAREAHINCLVIDVAPYKSMRPIINPEVIKECLKNGIYPIARVVAFQYGLQQRTVSQSHMNAIYKLVDLSVQAGFKEIQLDYIRYADGYGGMRLQEKYQFIENLLKTVKERINNPNILLSTDVFGRIVYSRDDVIGQQLETMAKYADVICPMVYPSHYYPDYFKLRNPYFTVRQSTIKGLNRVGQKTYIMPYIQAFYMNVRYTPYTMGQYIEVQVQAVEDTAARGYILWNARNQYATTFEALKSYYKRNPHKVSDNPSGYNPETGEQSADAAARGEEAARKAPGYRRDVPQTGQNNRNNSHNRGSTQRVRTNNPRNG